MIDKSKLESEDYYLLEEILKRHPEWLEYTTSHPESDTTFNITIPCPTVENPPICIDNLGEGPHVYFGPPHFDYYTLRSIIGVSWREWKGNWNRSDVSLHIDAVDIVIDKIVSEALIATALKSILRSFDLLEQKAYQNCLERNKVLISVSWLGTYNRNYNGEWSDPFPADITE